MIESTILYLKAAGLYSLIMLVVFGIMYVYDKYFNKEDE